VREGASAAVEVEVGVEVEGTAVGEGDSATNSAPQSEDSPRFAAISSQETKP
jgi:hypothetical protein